VNGLCKSFIVKDAFTIRANSQIHFGLTQIGVVHHNHRTAAADDHNSQIGNTAVIVSKVINSNADTANV
jgi:hypothetical protein